MPSQHGSCGELIPSNKVILPMAGSGKVGSHSSISLFGVAYGVVLGTVIGLVLGLLIKNILLGLSVGTSTGFSIGLVIGTLSQRSRDHRSRRPLRTVLQ